MTTSGTTTRETPIPTPKPIKRNKTAGTTTTTTPTTTLTTTPTTTTPTKTTPTKTTPTTTTMKEKTPPKKKAPKKKATPKGIFGGIPFLFHVSYLSENFVFQVMRTLRRLSLYASFPASPYI